jgi:hypothetical protein
MSSIKKTKLISPDKVESLKTGKFALNVEIPPWLNKKLNLIKANTGKNKRVITIEALKMYVENYRT